MDKVLEELLKDYDFTEAQIIEDKVNSSQVIGGHATHKETGKRIFISILTPCKL